MFERTIKVINNLVILVRQNDPELQAELQLAISILEREGK
jgi:hypothetical protein